MLSLCIRPESLAVCRLDAGSDLPAWAMAGSFFSVSRTAEEVSIVCMESTVPTDVRAERGWRASKVEGPLDFSLTGILSRIATPLADAGISIFAISTFDTDYVLVKESALEKAKCALTDSGHTVT